jgi:hypothetical protein
METRRPFPVRWRREVSRVRAPPFAVVRGETNVLKQLAKGGHGMKARIALIVMVSMLLVAPLMADPPDASGPYVVRFEDYGWWYYYADGLLMIHGADWQAVCNNEFPFTDLFQIQDVNCPADTDLIVTLTKGDDVDSWVYPDWFLVFDENGNFDIPATCYNVATVEPFASGEMDFVYTDNDLLGYLPHNRYNTWHLSAHGKLYTPDGDRMICNSGFHCVWNGDLLDPWQKCKTKINLH